MKPALLMAAMLALFWSGLFHLHPPTGWVDPALYISWFLNAPQNVANRALDYHGARLTYVAPGFLLYRFFEPLLAQKLLVSGFYMLGIVALYLFAGCFLRRFSARALLVLVVGANPLWIGSFARGYVDGPCMALGLLALTCLLRPKAAPGAWHHAAAGALLALALCAHTLGGGIAGLTAAAIGLIRAGSPRRLVTNAAAGVMGVLVCLGALGLVALALGMPFLFFRAFWAPLQLSVDGTYDAFSLPMREWLPYAPRLLLLVVILPLLALSAGVIRAEGRCGWAMAAAVLLPLVPLLVWLFRTASLFQYHFYASYLQLALVPVLGLFLARIERAGALPGRLALAGFGLALGLLVALGAFIPLEWRFTLPFALGTWAVVGGLVLAGLGLATFARHRAALAALAAGLILVGSLNADTARAYRLPGAPDLAAQMQGVARLHRFLEATGGSDGPYLLWLARDSFTAARGLGDAELHNLSFATTRLRMNLLDTLGGSLGWHTAAIGFAMPVFADHWGVENAATVRTTPVALFTLCAEPAECRMGMDTLVELGLTVEQGPIESIEVPGLPRFVVGRARLTTAIEQPTPRPGQLAAILARVEALDAAAAQGAAPLSRETRARQRLAVSPPGIGLVRGETDCTRQGARIDCRIGYVTADGMPRERQLVFQAMSHLALLVEAGPAEVPP